MQVINIQRSILTLNHNTSKYHEVSRRNLVRMIYETKSHIHYYNREVLRCTQTMILMNFQYVCKDIPCKIAQTAEMSRLIALLIDLDLEIMRVHFVSVCLTCPCYVSEQDKSECFDFNFLLLALFFDYILDHIL